MEPFRAGYIDGEGTIWGPLDAATGCQYGYDKGVVWGERALLMQYEEKGWQAAREYHPTHDLIAVRR